MKQNNSVMIPVQKVSSETPDDLYNRCFNNSVQIACVSLVNILHTTPAGSNMMLIPYIPYNVATSIATKKAVLVWH